MHFVIFLSCVRAKEQLTPFIVLLFYVPWSFPKKCLFVWLTASYFHCFQVIIKDLIELNITEKYKLVWCYACCCCQTCTSPELQVIFKVCRAFEFLMIMELWADFVSNRFWISVLVLSRGTPWQVMTPLPDVCWWLSAFDAHTGMSKSRHWSKRSCSAWLKEKGKQPVRPRKGTALLRRGREQPSW